jgi:DNA repair protein RadC
MKVQNIRLKVVRENIGEYTVSDFKVGSPKVLAELFESVFSLTEEAVENFCVMFLDTKNKVLGMDRLTIGTVNASLVSPRDVIQKALMVNAVGVAVCHNHPSYNTTPSQEDINITKQLKEACSIMGMKLIDHIIIGGMNYDNTVDYRSMREHNYVQF